LLAKTLPLRQKTKAKIRNVVLFMVKKVGLIEL